MDGLGKQCVIVLGAILSGELSHERAPHARVLRSGTNHSAWSTEAFRPKHHANGQNILPQAGVEPGPPIGIMNLYLTYFQPPCSTRS